MRRNHRLASVGIRIVGRKYLDLMPTEAREVHAELKKYFGASRMLYNIRNRFSYHHPTTEDLIAAFDQTPADEDWTWYVYALAIIGARASNQRSILLGLGLLATFDDRVWSIAIPYRKSEPIFVLAAGRDPRPA